MQKIFIDGKEGTTGLRIYDRLSQRGDIELITLSEADRKQKEKRRQALNACDIAFLCLPDAAALEAVEMVENSAVRIIDTSTAHRTDAGWVYGFPELGRRKTLETAKRVAVPGCHASGFVALVAPLLEAEILSRDIKLFCYSITGYSGGGKKMIAEYQESGRSPLFDAPRQYGLNQNHKHLKEMQRIPGLDNPPIFCPVVSDFYSGMQVTVPLFRENLNGADVHALQQIYRKTYTGPVVTFTEEDTPFYSAAELAGKDRMSISVRGNADRILLIAKFDNLGKGASGAAIQCMNIMLGQDQTQGLEL